VATLLTSSMATIRTMVMTAALASTMWGCAAKKVEAPPLAPPSVPVTWLTNFNDAIEKARLERKFLFVDAWAPWCHTCWSMKRDVLEQPALGRFSDRFVFVAVDTDRPENANFVAQHPITFWPTFFVIDDTGMSVAQRPGSMTLDETIALLGATEASSVEMRAYNDFSSAQRMMEQGRFQDAAAVFRILAKSSGPRRAEGALAWLQSLRAANDPTACVDAGLSIMDQLAGGAAGDIVGVMFACVDDAGAAKTAWKEERKAMLLTRLRQLVDKPAPGSSVDDQADVMIMLAEQLEGGDPVAAKQLHAQRLHLLEGDAAKHPDLEGNRVHDYARMVSYLAVGRGEDAVTLLRTRTTQAPNDYEPWARLAHTLHELHRDDEAKAAIDRALQLAYGPRQLRYWLLAADIAKARQQPSDERESLKGWLSTHDALPVALQKPAQLVTTRARLAALTSR
jgi:thiol-disulfide isomerase/thioredoxin